MRQKLLLHECNAPLAKKKLVMTSEHPTKSHTKCHPLSVSRGIDSDFQSLSGNLNGTAREFSLSKRHALNILESDDVP